MKYPKITVTQTVSTLHPPQKKNYFEVVIFSLRCPILQRTLVAIWQACSSSQLTKRVPSSLVLWLIYSYLILIHSLKQQKLRVKFYNLQDERYYYLIIYCIETSHRNSEHIKNN